MRFFVGLHQPSDARHFAAAFISVHRLENRKSGFEVRDWIMDSGAFTTVSKHGGYPTSVREYADQIRRWKSNGNLLAAVAQDFMCEDQVVARTGLSVAEHQRLTIERYDALLAENTGVYIIPVLQGRTYADYCRHLEQYGDRLKEGAWVGVGSVCKRNRDPMAIYMVLHGITGHRPDLRLHGFGVKTTSLQWGAVREMFYSADSMAWSSAARLEGRNANDWREARAFEDRINAGATW